MHREGNYVLSNYRPFLKIEWPNMRILGLNDLYCKSPQCSPCQSVTLQGQSSIKKLDIFGRKSVIPVLFHLLEN